MPLLRMPSPAENVDTVTLASWKVAVGNRIAPGHEVAELITEKANFPLESDQAGEVTHLLATPGSVLPPGVILLLLDADETAHAEALRENQQRLTRFAAGFSGTVAPAGATAPATPADGTGTEIRATPAARRLAKTLGIPLADIAAVHPAGTLIRDEHVRAFGV